MGYTVLYIAFGVVALWLLGEVLLQYKARLRWRLLAFAGFMGVVAGVAMRSVVVIALGAVAFAAGQTIVTLSYRRGFSTGWAIGGRPGASRRRRGREREWSEPTLSVTPVEPVDDAPAPPSGPMAPTAAGDGDGYGYGYDVTESEPPVYQPEALLDDTGEYPSYTGASYGPQPDPYVRHDAVADGYGYDTAAYAGGGYVPDGYGTGGPGDAYATGQAAYGADQGGYGYGQDGYADDGGYDPSGYTAGPQYGAYHPNGYDPAAQPYDPAAGGGYGQDDGWSGQPGQPGQTVGYDPYGTWAAPADGAWVPEQQGGQPYPPDPAGSEPGGYDQYRY
jgi:hypothetical protein